MTRRLWAGVVSLALAGALAGILAWRKFSPENAPPLGRGAAVSSAHPKPSTTRTFHRPSAAAVQFGVLTNASAKALEPFVDASYAARVITPDLCGDTTACARVKAFASEASHVHLEIVPRKQWIFPKDVGSITQSLSQVERDSITARSSIVVVHVGGQPLPDQLPARAGFALAAAIARASDGLVYDQVIDRIESAKDFAKHAVTNALGSSSFRADRIDVMQVARPDGSVRLLTVGLTRFGAPDIEIPSVSQEAASSLAPLLEFAAKSLVDGATSNPLSLIGRDKTPIIIELTDIHPENGDPNDVMVRVVAPGVDADNPYDLLATQMPDPAPATKEKTQATLSAVVSEFHKTPGATLYVQFPFAAGPEDEWMWVNIESAQAETLTGTLNDEPIGPTGLSRGARVSRARKDAVDYRLSLPDGTIRTPAN